MGRNAIVGQSGGPTAVINSSLVGVFQAAKSRGAQHVYGMRYGVKGLLEEQVVDLSDTLRDNLDIEILKRTPASYLGSCRYKLPVPAEDPALYEKLFGILKSWMWATFSILAAMTAWTPSPSFRTMPA